MDRTEGGPDPPVAGPDAPLIPAAPPQPPGPPASTAPPARRPVTASLADLLLAALFASLLAFQIGDTIEERRVPRSDAEQYLTMGFHIAHDATASLAAARTRPDRPSCHRTPAYPALLAAVILVSPGLRALTLEEILGEDSLPKLGPFWVANTMLLLCAAVLSMAIAWRATRSRIAAWLALAAVGLDATLLGRTANLLSENLAAPLLAAFSLALAIAVTRGRPALFAVSGFLLALLALTRPAFAYMWIPALILILSLSWWTQADPRRCRKAALVFMLAFAPLVTGWMARNAWHFDRFFLAQGSGINLDIRARLDRMTLRQGMASFALWARAPLARRHHPSGWDGYLDEDALAFLEGSDDRSFYQQAYLRRRELYNEHGAVEADRLQGREAMSWILQHPVRHLLATFPIAHRGIYQHEVIASVFLYACLVGVFALGVRRRDPLLVALFLPAVFSYGFHCLLSENIPRYNEPLVPLLWCALLVCAVRAIAKEAVA